MKRKNEKSYFKVTCKCGHADSKKKCTYIDFPIVATSRKEASSIARNLPRVKHHHKDCIRDCVEITFEEYQELLVKNQQNTYLQSHSIQQQRENVDYSIFEDDPAFLNKDEIKKKEISNKKCYDKKIIIKYPKIYLRCHILDYEINEMEVSPAY